MPSASNICKDRMDIFIQQVKDTHDVVFSTEEERRPDRPAVASFFTEAVSGEDKSAVEKQVKCSLLKNADAEPPTYAIVPHAAATKTVAGVMQIKVSPTVTTGGYLTEAVLFERYTHGAAGILKVGTHHGALAAGITENGARADIVPVAPEDGTHITHVRVDVGGVAAGDTPPVAIESALTRFGISWVPLGGEPAQAGGFQVKPVYADVIDEVLGRAPPLLWQGPGGG